MDLWKQFIATEERLLQEADSLGDFLSQFRSCVSPQLIGDRDWERILARSRELPVTLAAFPFGFEVPLHSPEPTADFGMSLLGGSKTAAFFQERGQAEGAETSAVAVAGLLDATDPEESPLRRIAGRKMLLEYDVDSAPDNTCPDPGIFMYPDKTMLIGDGSSERFRNLGVVVDAIASAAGLDLKDADRRQIEQVYMALTPETSIWGIGAFPSRKKGIRLAAVGFKKASDVTSFLERAGWPRQQPAIDAVVPRLEERNAFAHMGVHIDVDEGGMGSKLGLSFYAQEGEWLKDIRHWTALIDGMREEGFAVPEKLSELINWSVGSESLSGQSGTFVRVRGIHHVKFVLVGDQIEQVKAYIFMLIFSWPFMF